eukprot:Nk52_evm18s234 gene=Nk52_evmTU18s234
MGLILRVSDYVYGSLFLTLFLYMAMHRLISHVFPDLNVPILGLTSYQEGHKQSQSQRELTTCSRTCFVRTGYRIDAEGAAVGEELSTLRGCREEMDKVCRVACEGLYMEQKSLGSLSAICLENSYSDIMSIRMSEDAYYKEDGAKKASTLARSLQRGFAYTVQELQTEELMRKYKEQGGEESGTSWGSFLTKAFEKLTGKPEVQVPCYDYVEGAVRQAQASLCEVYKTQHVYEQRQVVL